jgi:hypothetical protein
MSALLTLRFDDGTERVITLKNSIEMNVSPERKQSIEFRETNDGVWVMAFTKPVLQGKKLAVNFLEVRKDT